MSGVAGYIGMNVSVRANVRIADASRKGLAEGLAVAFKAGAVTGMLVAGLALLAVAVYYGILKFVLDAQGRELVDPLVALGFGASLISIFARLGGGIFTKGADVGADLVGKVEAGIPEDDPRNPAVIADNVGDNVGDCAGMAADLFETYVVTIVATMVLASIFFAGLPIMPNDADLPARHRRRLHHYLGHRHLLRPARRQQTIMGALYKGFIASAVLSAVALWPITVVGDRHGHRVRRRRPEPSPACRCSGAALVGLAVTGLLIWITEYYTGDRLPPGADRRQGLAHRPRHQHHPGPGDLDGGDRASGA